MNFAAPATDQFAESRAVWGPRRHDQERHLAAVARSLGWARESAARGDYADALGWIAVIESLGDKVSPEYQVRRREWLRRLGAARAARSS